MGGAGEQSQGTEAALRAVGAAQVTPFLLRMANLHDEAAGSVVVCLRDNRPGNFWLPIWASIK